MRCLVVFVRICRICREYTRVSQNSKYKSSSDKKGGLYKKDILCMHSPSEKEKVQILNNNNNNNNEIKCMLHEFLRWCLVTDKRIVLLH